MLPCRAGRRIALIAARPALSAKDAQMPILNRAAALKDEVSIWRRDIHANPEVLYEVQRTAAVVADKLKAFGCDEVVPGIGRTGVVGVIKGRRQASGR